MSIRVGQYVFEGPYMDTSRLSDKSGVYAIHCYHHNVYSIIDIGESSTVKTRVENHDRKECWSRNCAGILTVSVFYTLNAKQAGRKKIEQKLRSQYNPICGNR